MRRPPDSMRTRVQPAQPGQGSGRKRDPDSPCAADCGTFLKYDSKWPICLACANRHLGLVGKALLSRRLRGMSRDQVHDYVDGLLDKIDGFQTCTPTPAVRRPRPGRSSATPRTRLRARDPAAGRRRR